MSFHMNIVDLIEDLDGAGLVITDIDEVKEELNNLGISINTNIPYDDEPEEDSENDEPTIYVSLKTLVQNDYLCDKLGFSPYCVNEGADGNELIQVNVSDAKIAGLM